ncbi:MAG: hypothetical protein K2M19_01955 [Muribaculaceae bacterium]|nr:hypothetical protein [Muribaculaceae bacterium]
MRYSLLTVVLASSLLSLSSCHKQAEFQGEWTATAPIDITSQIPQADRASSLMTISFIDDSEVNGGPVVLSSMLSINQAVAAGQLDGLDEAYEVDVAATASVSGKWMYKDDDRDELLLALDANTLQVNVDQNGVTFSQNLLTGAQQPEVDSLTSVTVQEWKIAITKAMTAEMQRFSYLDDVNVEQKGTILTFEVENPKQTLHFHRTN